MKATSIFSKASVAAGLTLLIGGAAGAQTTATRSVSFTDVPISNVVAQLNKKYGISIVLKGKFSPTKRVTFTVNNAGGTDARLRLVNAFADAVDGDYRKVYVLSKNMPGGENESATPDAPNSLVIFKTAQVPVGAAARAVAGADAAYVQIGPGVDGKVTFGNTNTTAGAAAAQIARQTDSHWKQFYAVAPHGQENLLTALNRADGDPSNQPISPLGSYTKANPAAQADNNTNVAQNPDGYANGGYPAFDPYNNPYGAFGDGSGLVNPGLGYTNDPYYAFQTGPSFLNGTGYPYQNTVGGYTNGGFSTGGGLVVLPTFPNFGGYGGPVVIGGY